MIKFDLSGLPSDISDTNLNEAALSLYCITGGTNSTPSDNHDSGKVHIISKSWKNDEVTWASAEAGNAWSENGGDFEQDDIATVPFVEAGNWENYNVTSAVEAFITKRSPNYGFIIATALDLADISGESSPQRLYIASDYDSLPLRPKLTIKYESTGISYFASPPVLNNNISIKITSEGIKFYIPFDGSYKVTLTDLKGRQIHSFNGNYKRWYQLPSSVLSTGMHIISATTEGKTAYRKFLFIK